jgi:hypothetical protein
MSAAALAALLLFAADAGAVALTRGPYLQRLTTASVLIVWNTDVSATCSLALRPLGGASSVINGTTGTVCAITVGSLTAGAQYGYTPRAGGIALRSESVFQVDDPALPYIFLVVGDTACSPHRRTSSSTPAT